MNLPELSQPELLRYSRHLTIPEVGLHGQQKLKAASVLLVGLGGLGSPAALYLAAAGVGKIGIVDYDTVDSSNLQRQVIHNVNRIGESKVVSARQQMLHLNPFIHVQAYNEALTVDNAERIAARYDVIIDGSDNFATRYLVSDLCVLTKKPYVFGAIYRFEGQVSVFDARQGPCYRCVFPEPPYPENAPTCAEGGVFGVLPGIIGVLQASEALKLLLGIGMPAIGRLILCNALDLSFQEIRLRKNPHCKICGEHPEITQLVDTRLVCGAPPGLHPEGMVDVKGYEEIDPMALAEIMRNGEPVHLVDVRETVELQISSLPGSVHIPYDRLSECLSAFEREAEIVLICRNGRRSGWAAQLMRNAGFIHARNLRGGLNAWAQQVEPAMRQY